MSSPLPRMPTRRWPNSAAGSPSAAASARGMETLKAIVRAEVLATIDSATRPQRYPATRCSGRCRSERPKLAVDWHAGPWLRGLQAPRQKAHGDLLCLRAVLRPGSRCHHITHTCEGDTALCVRPEHLLAVLPSEIGGSPLRSRRTYNRALLACINEYDCSWE